MKLVTLLFCALLTLNLAAQNQKLAENQSSKHSTENFDVAKAIKILKQVNAFNEHSKSSKNALQRLDSTIYQNLLYPGNPTNHTKMEYKYDNNNRLIYSYKLVESYSGWRNHTKLHYSYDGTGLLEFDTRSTWPPGVTSDWEIADSNVYIYDSSSRLSEINWYQDLYGNGNLVTLTKYTYTYDSNGNLISVKEYNKIDTNSNYILRVEEDFTYNTIGELTFKSIEYFDIYTGQPVEKFKTEYLYNPNNLLSIRTVSKWNYNNVQWTPSMQYNYYYTTSQHLIDIEKFKWSIGDALWVKNTNSEYSYNTNMDITEIIHSNWQPSTHQYIPYLKYSYVHNAAYPFDSLLLPLSEWHESLLINFTHQLDTSYQHRYDTVSGTWSKWTGTLYFYTPTNIGIAKPEINDWSVYPNPANDFISIELPADVVKDQMVTIYDLGGKIVKSMMVSGSETRISINDLKPGVYILSINGTSGQYRKKLIITK